MDYCGYLKFVCQYSPAVFMRNTKMHSLDLLCLIPSDFIYYICCYLRYSLLFKTFSLIDMGGYDLAHIKNKDFFSCYVPTLWYVFKDLVGCRLFLFSWHYISSRVDSVDVLFRNARWLEREAAEFFGIFFTGKLDRRVLFTLPLFYNAPFRRKYPSVGFYELLYCPLLRRLRFRHLSTQS